MAKVGPLNTPFTRDPFSPPKPSDKFGLCTEGNPESIRRSDPGDDTSVVDIVLYHKSDAVKIQTPAALNSPMGTGISGLGRPKRS